MITPSFQKLLEQIGAAYRYVSTYGMPREVWHHEGASHYTTTAPTKDFVSKTLAAADQGINVDPDADGIHNCAGWEVICPDGLKRHYPYHNYGDAKSHAKLVSDPNWYYRPSCRLAPNMAEAESSKPTCPGGLHIIAPIIIAHKKGTNDNT